eukprot:tig00000870_g5120.t1
MMQSNANRAVVINCANVGIHFIDSYYKILDSDRQNAHQFYKEDSVVVWNGNRNQGGLAALSQFFASLPLSRHEALSMDCQPLPDGNQQPTGSKLLVTVLGTVTYAEVESHRFSQNFILMQENSWFIVSDTFRFLS